MSLVAVDHIKKFCVIYFEDNSVGVAPRTWLSEDSTLCSWPKKENSKFKSLQKTVDSQPLDGWERYLIKEIVRSYGKLHRSFIYYISLICIKILIMGFLISDSFDSAANKRKKFLKNLDDTDVENGQIQKRPEIVNEEPINNLHQPPNQQEINGIAIQAVSSASPLGTLDTDDPVSLNRKVNPNENNILIAYSI